LATALGRIRDRLLRLALGADQKNAAATRDDVPNRLQALMQHRFGLFEIDDVDPVADAENVRRHLGVPPSGMMAEMNAGFEQLAH
jgi:hypothetical protein